MFNIMHSILELSIIILMILHTIISKKISGNNLDKIISNIKIRILIDIILSIAYIIETSILILIGKSVIIIALYIVVTIIYEANVDSGIRSLRFLKKK